jgi:membrane-associated phospholipid phosphatase
MLSESPDTDRIEMTTPKLFLLAVLASSMQILCGCGALPDDREWRHEATVTPGWQKLGESAVRAARSPYTWVPLAGAALLQICDWDRDLSNWATRETPLFGSEQSALDASGVLKDISLAAWAATALATPGGDSAGEWLAAKSGALAVVAVAKLLNEGMTNSLKNHAQRTRPDGSNNESMPSGHSSSAALNATFASRNARFIAGNPGYRKAMQIGFGMIAAGTAWARVEGGVHYPSDVLAGAALGHVIAAFVNDAFMGLNASATASVNVAVTPESASLQFWHAF